MPTPSLDVLATLVESGARRHPELHRRLLHALALLVGGHVDGPDSAGVWTVRSESNPAFVYEVDPEHGPACTCPDHEYAPGRYCKHALAVALLVTGTAREMQRQPTGEGVVLAA